MKLATHPCKGCGEPVAPIISADANGATYTIHVDANAVVYYRQSDGEGGVFWSQVRSADIAVRHICPRGA